MHIQQGQFRRHIGAHLQRRQHGAQSPKGTADNIAGRHPIACQFQRTVAQACHVQQILDITVEALGLVASAFEQFAAILQGDGFTKGQQAVDAAAHGGQWRAQVVGHRREQSAAQLFGFAVQARRFQLLPQLCPRQCLGQRLAQRGEQASTLPAQFQARLGTDTQQPQGPLFTRQRPPPPTPKRQGAGAHAGRLIMLPGPVGGGAFSFGEGQRATGLDLPAALSIAIDQAQIELVPTLQMVGGGTDDSLAVGGSGELARQVEQFAGFFLGIAQRLQLAALACGEVAGQRCHQQEEQQGQHVFFALDGEGKIRRNKQKIVSQKRQCGTHQGRPQAAAHRHQQHGGKKHQRDVRQRQRTGHGPGHCGSGEGRHHRQGVIEPHQPAYLRQTWRCRHVIAVEDVDFQAAGIAQQACRQAATEQAPPPAHP